MSTKTTKVNKLKRVKIGPMTVSQFRAKLEGIEMFQEENWTPSKEQWGLIREMINNIEAEPMEISNNWVAPQPQTMLNSPTLLQPQTMLNSPRMLQPQTMIPSTAMASSIQIPEQQFDTTAPSITSGGTIDSSKYVIKSDGKGNIKSAFE